MYYLASNHCGVVFRLSVREKARVDRCLVIAGGIYLPRSGHPVVDFWEFLARDFMGSIFCSMRVVITTITLELTCHSIENPRIMTNNTAQGFQS